MIGLEDRQALAQDIDVAHKAGARLRLACETAGIDLRTLQRWKAGVGLVKGDARPGAVRRMPSHALSAEERAQVLRVANEPRFADVPPARIVPMLADEGTSPASPASPGCCASTASTAAVPSHLRPAGHRPRTWPPRRGKSGAGT